MRGKVPFLFAVTVALRITPACAGKRVVCPGFLISEGDHPRVCGEKGPRSARVPGPLGSPPRVRGKDYEKDLKTKERGITPACAGKSQSVHSPSQSLWDHPRVCGEKLRWGGVKMQELGSPPRVRGKVPETYRYVAGYGITPACAGKRLKRSHSIGHFSCILCLFHSVLHRASVSGGSRAGPCAPPCLPAQNAVPV